MRAARAQHAVCEVSGELYVSGGHTQTATARVEVYSPSVDSWNDVVPIPAARRCHSTVSVGSDMCDSRTKRGSSQRCLQSRQHRRLVRGGNSAGSALFDGGLRAARGTHLCFGWAPSQSTSCVHLPLRHGGGAWTTLEPTPKLRCGHASVVLGGLIYVQGGNMLGSVVRFDPAAGSWSTPAAMSTPRDHFASFVLEGQNYAAGGARRGVKMLLMTLSEAVRLRNG